MIRSAQVSLAIAALLVSGCSGKDDAKKDGKEAVAKDEEKSEDKSDKPAEEPEPEPDEPEPAAEGAFELVPGEGIGPIRLGMAKAEVEALGILETHPNFSAMTIPISVHYDDGDKAKVVEVSLSHAEAGVKIGDLAIAKGTKVEEVTKLLGDCGEPQVNEGGTLHPCREGKLTVAIGSADPDEVWLRVETPAE